MLSLCFTHTCTNDLSLSTWTCSSAVNGLHHVRTISFYICICDDEDFTALLYVYVEKAALIVASKDSNTRCGVHLCENVKIIFTIPSILLRTDLKLVFCRLFLAHCFLFPSDLQSQDGGRSHSSRCRQWIEGLHQMYTYRHHHCVSQKKQ